MDKHYMYGRKWKYGISMSLLNCFVLSGFAGGMGKKQGLIALSS